MKVFIFGNGNTSFNAFVKFYIIPLDAIISKENVEFLICDFRGVDTLTMEFLKSISSSVTIYHIGEKPRYYPDKYKTKVSQWTTMNGFNSDDERDLTAINNCTHFLAKDFNSNDKRISGTQKNIRKCLSLGKIDLSTII